MNHWGKLRAVVVISAALAVPIFASAHATRVDNGLTKPDKIVPKNLFYTDEKIRERRGILDAPDESGGDVPVAGLTPQQILEILLSKYRSKVHPEARMLFKEFNEKDIAENCGTSASLRCGKDVLLKVDGGDDDVNGRCDLRKTFLECIDTSRRECRLMAKNGLFPILPPKSEISKIQRKVWRALWTAGGCVLGY